ncbi:MAG: DUF4340 domain-containing protein [Phycisphaerae bacterium]
MMTDKKFTILGVAAAVMVVLALVMSMVTSKKGAPAPDVVTYLIQGLDMAPVQQITVKGTSSETVVLTKKDGKFYVDSAAGYPAKVSAINDLLTKCLDVKIGELYTANVSNFDDLEVSDEKARYVVKFFDEAGDVLTGLIVGANKQPGNYVRKFADNKVYISQASFWANTSSTSYIETTLTELKSEDISEVSLSSANGAYKITATEAGKQLEGIPAGKQAKGTDYVNVFNALNRLSFSDVAKEESMPELNFDYTYVASMKDSTVYRFEVAQKGGDYWAKCSSVFTNDEKVMKANKAESEEELKAKEEVLLGREAAINFTQKHKGWVYKLQSWSAKNLTKPFDELIEDAPTAEPAPAAEPSADPNAV